jgi:hypothetical protein
MIEVCAKQERKSPEQRAIVKSKDLINKRTSKLISILIALKKGWNGGPSPNIGVEKYNLTQPIPDIIVGTGDAALNEFSDIVQTLLQIKKMQDAYAVSHSQRADKLKQVQQDLPSQAPANDTPQQQISEAVEEVLFSKFASNPLTRAWSHISAYNPFGSFERGRRERLGLLRSLARIDRNLKIIEDKVLSGGENSILEAFHDTRALYMDAKSSFFGTFRDNLNEMITTANEELERLGDEVKKSEMALAHKDKEQNALVVQKDILKQIRGLQSLLKEKDRPANDTGPIRVEKQTSEPVTTSDRVRLPSRPDIAEDAETKADAARMADEVARKAEEKSDAEPDNMMAALEASRAAAAAAAAEAEARKATAAAEKARVKEVAKEKRDREAAERARLREEKKGKPAGRSKKPEGIDLTQLESEPPKSEFADQPVETDRQRKLRFIKYVSSTLESLNREINKERQFSIPEPWDDKVDNAFNDAQILSARVFDAIKSAVPGSRDYLDAFFRYFRAVGYLKAICHAAKAEETAISMNPGIVPGSTIDDNDMSGQSLNYVEGKMSELKDVILSINSGKVAQASSVSRFMKRMLTHLSPRRDKHLRLTISRNVRDAREGLQGMMDSLEQKDINFRNLIAKSRNFYDSFIRALDEMIDLANMYNSTVKVEKAERKYKSVQDKKTYRMPFDIIGQGDISSVARIKQQLEIDRTTISKLYESEQKMSKLYKSQESLPDDFVEKLEDAV